MQGSREGTSYAPSTVSYVLKTSWNQSKELMAARQQQQAAQ